MSGGHTGHDDEFDNYVETTIDLGWIVIVFVVVFCVTCLVVLAVLVAWRGKRKHRQNDPLLNDHVDVSFTRIVAWDNESKAITHLAAPLMISALARGLSNILTLAVIARLIGTRAVSAKVAVYLPLHLTGNAISGVLSTLSTLCSQALGTGNFKLSGQYVQISLIIYTLLWIPNALLWGFSMKSVVTWFGFDETTVQVALAYLPFAMIHIYLHGFSQVVHSLLNVTGHAVFSTQEVVAEEIVHIIVLILVAWLGNPTLRDVGIIQVIVGVVFMAIRLYVIKSEGWFCTFAKGFWRSAALNNWQAVKLMLKTAAPLSVGYLLVDAEWEILAILAGVLGPAEVAAWGIAGTIFRALESTTAAMGFAGEIRCATLLGEGEPDRARLSSYKTIYLGHVVALVFALILIPNSWRIAGWMTEDATLQTLVTEIVPIFAIGHVGTTVGSLSWYLIGAQGRYRLATTVAFVGSWALAIPLALLSCMVYHINLEGLTASVVVGNMVAGTINAYILLRSNWSRLSNKVIKRNSCYKAQSDDETAVEEEDGLEVCLSQPIIYNSGPLGSNAIVGQEDEDWIDELDLMDDLEEEVNKELVVRKILPAQNLVHQIVVSPPGLIGTVIESSERGPVVSLVAEDSVLFDELLPGDVIVAINDMYTGSSSGEAVSVMLKAEEDKERRIHVARILS